MKRFMTVLLAAFIMLVAAATIAYAEESEDNGANETETDSEDSGEEGNETPGFEVAFAAAAALTVARHLKNRLL